VYWAPTWPYKSSLTGITSKDLGAGYETSSGKQWNQQLGASLSLFDVAAAVLKASGDPKNKQKIVDAMKTLTVETPVGNLDWTKNPNFGPGTPTVSGVVSAPIIGGQWKQNVSKWPIDFVICENSSDGNVPVASTLQPYQG
jgi:branched-chain amino acid transport system substrate-binding protein